MNTHLSITRAYLDSIGELGLSDASQQFLNNLQAMEAGFADYAEQTKFVGHAVHTFKVNEHSTVRIEIATKWAIITFPSCWDDDSNTHENVTFLITQHPSIEGVVWVEYMG